MVNSEREKWQRGVLGAAISDRLVRGGLSGKVIFEHRVEESEGMNQWNLGRKLSRQREQRVPNLRAWHEEACHI